MVEWGTVTRKMDQAPFRAGRVGGPTPLVQGPTPRWSVAMRTGLIKGLFWLGWSLILLAIPAAIIFCYLGLLPPGESWLVASIIGTGVPFIGVILMFGVSGRPTALGPNLSECLLTNEEFASEAPDAVVVLIHGTFAPEAEWMQKTSKIVQHLRSGLGRFKIAFCKFQWKGNVAHWLNNSHLDRYVASQRLSLLLDAIEGRFPTSRIFLVAHSHGGNVALYAANAKPARSSLAGIVTMGTPFIQVTARKVEDDLLFSWSCKEAATLAWIGLLVASFLGSLSLFFAGIVCLTSLNYLIKAVGVIAVLLALPLGFWYLESDGIGWVWVPDSTSTGGHWQIGQKVKIGDWVEEMRDDWEAALLRFVASLARERQDKLIAELDARVPSTLPVLCLTTGPDEMLRLLGRGLPIIGALNTLLSSETAWIIFVAVVLLSCCGGALVAGAWVPIMFFRDYSFSFLGLFACLLVGSINTVVAFFVLTTGSILVGVVVLPLWMLIRAPTAWPQLLAYGSANLWAIYFTRTSVAPEPRSGGDGKVEISVCDLGNADGLNKPQGLLTAKRGSKRPVQQHTNPTPPNQEGFSFAPDSNTMPRTYAPSALVPPSASNRALSGVEKLWYTTFFVLI
jgi:pimeloyl-ACP methyl ester carboxylesterase